MVLGRVSILHVDWVMRRGIVVNLVVPGLGASLGWGLLLAASCLAGRDFLIGVDMRCFLVAGVDCLHVGSCLGRGFSRAEAGYTGLVVVGLLRASCLGRDFDAHRPVCLVSMPGVDWD